MSGLQRFVVTLLTALLLGSAAPAAANELADLLRGRPARQPLSLYDPHPAPADRPWFEGYYTRIVPDGWDGSLAVLAGTCAAPGGVPQPGYAAVLVQRPGVDALEVHEAFPTESGFRLTHGTPEQRPDVRSPPGFRWTAPGLGWFTQDAVSFRFPDGTALDVRFEAPLSWSRRGLDRGPEGYLVHLPFLTQHWFVYSVASRCRYTLQRPGVPPVSGAGLAHQEKNWGFDFPKSWTWSQGLRSRPGEPDFAQLALAGGEVDLRLGAGPRPPETGWLLGVQIGARVRAFESPLDRFEVVSDPAAGRLVLVAEGQRDRAEVTVAAPLATFVRLKVPTAQGFRPGAIESFRAEARVTLFERSGPASAFRRAVSTKLSGVALEFGTLVKSGKQ